PKFAARNQEHHYADLGSLETYDDALFEFFREDSRRWLVNLVEVAVGNRGTLTAELVDRPAPDGTPRASLAGLVLDVEPGNPLLARRPHLRLGPGSGAAPLR